MPIKFKCKECGKRYQVADEQAGKRFQCKSCGSPVEVPFDVFLETVDRMQLEIGVEMEATSPAVDDDDKPSAARRERHFKLNWKTIRSWKLGIAIGIGLIATIAIVVLVYVLAE